MVRVENLKEKAMQEVKMEMELSRKFGEGYEDGYHDGYNRALEDVNKIVRKYNLGGSDKPQEKELKPAIHFLHQPVKKLYDKVLEEVDEAVQAYDDGEKRARVAEEIVDVQLACETLLAKIGLTENERREARINKIRVNEKRGYYMPDRSKYGD
jgi:flagellar biosynthesis/type III secretory pathway protein FliH